MSNQNNNPRQFTRQFRRNYDYKQESNYNYDFERESWYKSAMNAYADIREENLYV